MSNSRLSLFFSGTHMTWEDTALFLELGAQDRHNLRNLTAKHSYYIFDGPAASMSDQHKPVEQIGFDKKQDDFMRANSRKMQNFFGNAYRWAHGSGMNNITQSAYELILYSILENGVRNIDLIGFSRGGNVALNLGAFLSNLEVDLKGKLSSKDIDAIEINIYAIDPVAGKMNNGKSDKLGALSRYVKKCIVGIATNESVPGFHPRGILSDSEKYNIKFNPITKYIFLPFPEDHAMCQLWMKDIIRCQLPPDSELLLPCDEKRLINRRLGKSEVNWIGKHDETRTYRLIHYLENKEKYTRSILPAESKNDSALKKGTETFFKFLSTQRMVYNVGHISIQNDADSEIKNRVYEGKKIGGARLETYLTQVKFAKRNNQKFSQKIGFTDRVCKQKISEFSNFLFVNLLHESMFAKSYPKIYRLLVERNFEIIDSAINEFEQIPETSFPFTKAYIENALILLKNVQLKPIEHFKSTNLKKNDELMAMVFGDRGHSESESKLDAAEVISNNSDCNIIKLKKMIYDSIVTSIDEIIKIKLLTNISDIVHDYMDPSDLDKSSFNSALKVKR